MWCCPQTTPHTPTLPHSRATHILIPAHIHTEPFQLAPTLQAVIMAPCSRAWYARGLNNSPLCACACVYRQVTQCLGVLAPVDHWYMVVAKPSGSVDNYPREGDLHAFRIPHGVYVKMEKVSL